MCIYLLLFLFIETGRRRAENFSRVPSSSGRSLIDFPSLPQPPAPHHPPHTTHTDCTLSFLPQQSSHMEVRSSVTHLHHHRGRTRLREAGGGAHQPHERPHLASPRGGCLKCERRLSRGEGNLALSKSETRAAGKRYGGERGESVIFSQPPSDVSGCEPSERPRGAALWWPNQPPSAPVPRQE